MLHLVESLSWFQDLKKQMLEDKEEEGMGVATIHYGETDAFIQHIKTELWLSYQVKHHILNSTYYRTIAGNALDGA